MDVDQETLFDVELHDQSTEDGEYATKLDEMMELVMIFLNDCKDTDPDIFASLLRAFHRLVVPTNTKCVQFLVFYMASLRPENADHILGSLFANLEDERENISSRRAYSAHLGTLVGRAPFVSTSSVAHVLEAFCSFMDGYVECFGEESPTTNMMVNKHALFYTVFQCACYIISFNHDRLYQASERSDYFAQLRFERVMMCALNPLKVCYPPLMKDFGRIMSRYGIKCGLSIIERNERSFGGGNFSTENALDFFFPYDPACLAQRLKKCALYISPICYGDPDRLEEMRTGYQSDGESDMDSFQRSRSMNYMGEEEDDSTRHPTLALMDVKKSSHPPNDDGLGKSLPRFSFGSTSGSYDPNGTVVSPLLAAMSTSGPKKNSFSQMSIHPLHTKNSFGSKADMSSFMLEDQPCQSLGSSEDW